MTEPAAVEGSDPEGRRVTVVADDVLPRPDERSRAAGMRAWAIGEGLRANGLAVTYAVRTRWWPGGRPLPVAREFERYWSSAAELDSVLDAFDPNVIVNCSYPSLLTPRAVSRIVVQDVNGPRLLEGAFHRPASLERSAWKEATAYVGADYFVCGGQRQLAFFYPWLALSGFDLTESDRVGVVRVGVADAPLDRCPVARRLISTGSLLPWVDPRKAWSVAAEEVQQVGGELRLLLSDDGAKDGRVEVLREELARLGRVDECEIREGLSWSAFAAELSCATAAVDLMARNGERDLAVPTRTLSYFWAGLPPILGDYGELGELVARYDAGWVVDPSDEQALRRAIRQALRDAELVCRKSENARRLHDEQLRPSLATRGLAQLCRRATRRSGKRVTTSGRLRRRLLDKAFRLARNLAFSPVLE